MKAIVLEDFGDTDKLRLRELPDPEPSEGEVLVQVRAASINPVDVKTRAGSARASLIRQEPVMILGYDISGVVVRVGPGTGGTFREGDEVFGMIRVPGVGRAYAEMVTAPVDHLAFKPANISHEQAAAASLAAVTAWQALVTHAQVQPGWKVLIHGASGGVGHFAVQIARYLGAHVTGSSSAANRQLVLDLGAHAHLDYAAAPFEEQADDFDFILDHLGGSHIDRSLKALKPGGTIISLPSGVSETVGEKAAAQGKKGIFFMVKSDREDIRRIAHLLGKGMLRAHVSKVYPFTRIGEAHTHVGSGKAVGKVVAVW